MMFTPTQNTPYISVTGVTKTQANKAIRWLANRSHATWYDAKQKSLNAFPWKGDEKYSYGVLYKALEETK